jgi:hypothetical protein
VLESGFLQDPLGPSMLAGDLQWRGLVGPEHRQFDNAADTGAGGGRDQRLLLCRLPAGLPGEQEQPVHPVQCGVDRVRLIELGGDAPDPLLGELILPSGATRASGGAPASTSRRTTSRPTVPVAPTIMIVPRSCSPCAPAATDPSHRSTPMTAMTAPVPVLPADPAAEVQDRGGVRRGH